MNLFMRLNNYFYILAQYLEEMVRNGDESSEATTQGGICSASLSLLAMCLYRSLADKFPEPLHYISFYPLLTLGVLLLIYLIFLIIYVPLWILSWFITVYGSYLVLIVAIQFLFVFVGRSIAFPGCNKSTSKHMASDVMRRLSEFIENTAIATNDYTSSVMLVARDILSSEDSSSSALSSGSLSYSSSYGVEQIWSAIEYFPSMTANLKDAVDNLRRDRELTVEELPIMTQLCTTIEDFYRSFSDLYNFTVENNISSPSLDQTRLSRNKVQELLKLAAKCLQLSEKVRICAGDMRPTKADHDDGSGVLMSILKMLSSFSSGLTRYEKLSFPYLRAILKNKYSARFVSIRGNSQNAIDGVYLFAEHEAQRKRKAAFGDSAYQTGSGGQSESSNSAKPNTNGVVFFCSPNAAFYECIAQTDFEKSWFGFYMDLGMDIFVYNYRGYGRSEGTPNPRTLKADAVKLLEHIRKEFKPLKVIVHGESIGGMIACYLARHAAVDGLVCDRTFASLDATASRLMGNWAGYSLKYGALWNTEVAPDYLACTCPKLILQDPHDEIIADPSSLRCGVASLVLLGQTNALSVSEPAMYRVARYSKGPLPNAHQSEQWLLTLTNSSKPIPMEFITHFYACCIYIAEKAAHRQSQHLNRQKNANASTSGVNRGAFSTLTKIEMVQRKGGYCDETSTQSQTKNTRVLVADGPVEDSLQESLINEESEDGDSQRSFTNSTATPVADNQDQISPEYLYRLMRRLRMDELLSFKVENQSFHGQPVDPFQKAWYAILRVDGGFGQFLGQAVIRQLDALKCWVLSFVLWNHDELHAISSKSYGRPVITATEAAEDIRKLREELHAEELQDDSALLFVQRGLLALAHRNSSIAEGKIIMEESVSKSGRDVESNLAVQPMASYGSTGGICCDSDGLCRPEILLRGVTDKRCCKSEAVSIDHLSTTMLGKLLPLTCGHNGSPSVIELNGITSWLVENKIVSPLK